MPASTKDSGGKGPSQAPTPAPDPTPKVAVAKEDALEAPPVPPPAARTLKPVRFVCTLGADKPLDLGNGRMVAFHVPVDNVTQSRAAYGWYETADPLEIATIRAIITDKRRRYLFERESS
jgi:hypothetical protein